MRAAALLILVVTLSACGGSSPSTASKAPTAGQPTSAVQPSTGPTIAPPPTTEATAAASSTPPPAAGGTTATVILTGGPDAGTYTGTDNPLCSKGLVGTDIWGAQYSNDGAPGKLSSVQIVAPPAGNTEDHFSALVGIGPLLTANNYRLDDATGSATVTDNGATAVIHVTGTTEDGVGIDATINCPAIFR